MRSTFAGLNTALRALQAQQMGLDVANHNMANINTEGFTRQAAEFIPSTPFTMPGTTRPQTAGQLGTGVTVAYVRRFRDGFADSQVRTESATFGQWKVTADTLTQVEEIFNEPSDMGISAAMSRFWNDWSSLGNAPESEAVRKGLLENAVTLTDQMRHAYEQLTAVQRDVDTQIGLRVIDINNYLQRIANLNNQIVKIVGAGDQPNDLRDERDLLVDRLSELVKISYAEDGSGAVQINVGGRTAVLGNQAFLVKTDLDNENNNFFAVRWADDDQLVNATSGKLRGLLDVRDVRLADTIASLDSLAATLIDTVNTQHALGFGLNDETGLPFLAGTGADDIKVDDIILADLDSIAAASSPASPGDGSNALALNDLRRALVMNGDSVTISDFYNGMISQLGVNSQQAQALAESQSLLLQHLDRKRQETGGVSLDEEATNLIRFQRGYEAAARAMTVMDELLDRIINGMGLVGR